ncbi:MAG: DUF547 domain-containing protein [Desulfohalobiaceae bacterium]|nr:DUF547 domain-containing protein [Desulfohalobiaceae bacterium]
MKLIHVSLVALLMFSFPAVLSAAPKADLWEYWEQHDPDSSLRLDHSVWSGLLKDNITPGPEGINRFDYQGITEKDRRRLDSYIQALAGTQIGSLSRASQKPFWINLYNALTVQVVLDHYPVESIKDIDISPGFFASGPWGKKLVRVEDKELSLNDIEHRILRPVWKDPRIHYGVNCASLGCPNLQTEAYTPQNIETLLDKGARAYVNHPRGVDIDGGDLVVSSIYTWFQEDFGGSDTGVIEHLMHYAEPELKNKLQGFDAIDDDHYDWSLNETP